MKHKIAIIHTSPVSLQDLKDLCSEILPDCEVMNIIDDSLLNEVKKDGLTPNIIRRMGLYAQQAELMGAEIILNQCSSVEEAVDVVSRTLKVPYVKIDQAMAEKAVELGSRIGVVATVQSTVSPSCNLVRRCAAEANKDVVVTPYLVDGALDILMQEKNVEKHNMLVLDAIKKAEKENDVVVLAQGSLTVMIPYLSEIKKPVLTSPRMGIERLKEMLGE